VAVPQVSIVIPTRDRWKRLYRTLFGVLEQHRVQVEVVVVDDGDTEQTQRGVAALGDPRVALVPNRERGVSNARNLGIERAQGDWIAFLDDDDLWSPDKLHRQCEAATSAGAVFAYTDAVPVDDQLRVLPGSLPRPPPAEDVRARLILSNAVPAGCSNVLARAEVVKSVSGFDPRFAQVADWDMWLQLAAEGPAVALDEVHVAYVQHPQSMLFTEPRDPFLEFELLREKHAHLAASVGSAFSPPHYARWVATRLRRTGDRQAAVRMLLRSSLGLHRANLTNLARALALLTGGERALSRGRRLLSREAAMRPHWLDSYAAEPPGA